MEKYPNIWSCPLELHVLPRHAFDLADHIDEVEEFAEEELCRVPVVLGTVSMLLSNILCWINTRNEILKHWRSEKEKQAKEMIGFNTKIKIEEKIPKIGTQ